MAYAGYAASVAESPFKLYSQSSFGSGELDFNPSCCNSKNHQPTKNHQHNVYLQQQTQQHHQKQHLHHQLQQKLVQHNSQQHHHQQQRVYITRQLILCAVMTLAIVAALCAFAPGSSATQKWSSSSVTVRQQAGNNMVSSRSPQQSSGQAYALSLPLSFWPWVMQPSQRLLGLLSGQVLTRHVLCLPLLPLLSPTPSRHPRLRSSSARSSKAATLSAACVTVTCSTQAVCSSTSPSGDKPASQHQRMALWRSQACQHALMMEATAEPGMLRMVAGASAGSNTGSLCVWLELAVATTSAVGAVPHSYSYLLPTGCTWVCVCVCVRIGLICDKPQEWCCVYHRH